MKDVIRLAIAALLCGEASLMGAASANSRPPTSPASLLQPVQVSELVIVDGDYEVIEKEMHRKLSPLLAGKKFADLDAIADEYRRAKTQIASGGWLLGIFYCEVLDLPDEAVDADWRKRIDLLKEWTQARPESITARVALGRAYLGFAWHARGGDWANTVTQEGWRLFKVRLQQGENVLLKARNLKAKCPAWWLAMQVVALGLGYDRQTYEKLFNEAIAFEPSYLGYYTEKMEFLLPRWYGKEGEWQRFADEMANRVGGQAGDILYARMGWAMHDRRAYDCFVRDSGICWPRMRRGLEALMVEYPKSLTLVSEFAYLARQANDYRGSRELFSKLGKNVDYGVYRTNTLRFLQDRTWAMVGNPIFSTPLVLPAKEPPSQRPDANAKAPVVSPAPSPQTAQRPNAPELVLNGISGPPNRRLAMINSQTFEKGEVASVKAGQAVLSVKCLDIKEGSAVVMVEGSNQPREIRLK